MEFQKESKYSITFPGIMDTETKWDPLWLDELKFMMKLFPALSKFLSAFTFFKNKSHGNTPIKSFGLVVILYIRVSM